MSLVEAQHVGLWYMFFFFSLCLRCSRSKTHFEANSKTLL